MQFNAYSLYANLISLLQYIPIHVGSFEYEFDKLFICPKYIFSANKILYSSLINLISRTAFAYSCINGINLESIGKLKYSVLLYF